MTWYTVGLPISSYEADEITIQDIYNRSDYDLLCESAMRGLGRQVPDEEVEQYHRELAEELGIDYSDADGYDELYVWLDPPGAYYEFFGSSIREATVEEILNVGPIKFKYTVEFEYGIIDEEECESNFDTLGDLLKDWYGDRKYLPENDGMCYDIYLNYELYEPYREFETLLKDLEIIDLPVPNANKKGRKASKKKRIFKRKGVKR